MGLALSAIQSIAARYGNKFIQDQVNAKAQLLSQKVLVKEKMKGEICVINVDHGSADSVAIIGGGQQFAGSSGDSIGDFGNIVQMLVRPVSMAGQARIPFDSAKVVSGEKDSINLVKRQFDKLGASLAQDLSRNIMSSVVCVYTAANTGAGNDIAVTDSAKQLHASTIADVTGLRVGRTYDVYEASSSLPTGNRLGRVKIASISRSGSGSTAAAGTVTVTSLAKYEGRDGATIVAATGASRCLVTPGSWFGTGTTETTAEQFTSLSSAAGSGDLYGTTASNVDWSGNDSASTALSPAALREFIDVQAQRGGEDPDVFVMNRLAFAELEAASMATSGTSGYQAQRVFGAGDSLDVYGKNLQRPMFMGKSVILEENCPALSIFALSKDAVSLGEWMEFGPLLDKNPVEMSQTRYEYLVKCGGMANLLVKRRNLVSRFNISALT